jgi:hypothetical protein
MFSWLVKDLYFNVLQAFGSQEIWFGLTEHFWGNGCGVTLRYEEGGFVDVGGGN